MPLQHNQRNKNQLFTYKGAGQLCIGGGRQRFPIPGATFVWSPFYAWGQSAGSGKERTWTFIGNQNRWNHRMELKRCNTDSLSIIQKQPGFTKAFVIQMEIPVCILLPSLNKKWKELPDNYKAMVRMVLWIFLIVFWENLQQSDNVHMVCHQVHLQHWL